MAFQFPPKKKPVDDSYLQIGAPPSPEGSPEEEAAESPEDEAAEQAAGEGDDPANAHYQGPENRCYNCDFFEDPDRCKKGVNGGRVDAEGGCELFKPVAENEDSGSPMPAGLKMGSDKGAGPGSDEEF